MTLARSADHTKTRTMTVMHSRTGAPLCGTADPRLYHVCNWYPLGVCGIGKPNKSSLFNYVTSVQGARLGSPAAKVLTLADD